MSNDKQQDRDALLKRVAELESQLAAESSKRNEAEEMAHALAAGTYQGSFAEEQATGKTIMVSLCVNPAEKKESKHVYKEVEMPTYFYKIDLPLGAGVCLSTNGQEYYHGQIYEFDVNMLREIKARVAACWYHEKSIHGENENAYKPRDNAWHKLMGKAA